MFLVASPDAAARRVVEAIISQNDVTDVPGFWRVLMLVVRAIPEHIFKRMRL
jgi:hypothetical protein